MKALQRFSTLGLLALLLSGSAFTFSVEAQEVQRERLSVEERNDFVLEPGKQEIILAPGESVTKHLSITNRSRDTITFDIGIEDIAGSENSDQAVVLLGEETGPYSLKDFVTFSANQVTLGFGDRVRIPFTVSIPEDAEPGGKYGAIIASNAPVQIDGEIEGTETTIVSRLGSILLVRVEGEVEAEGSLEEMRLMGGKNLYLIDSPTGFEVLFRNSGSVHLVPHGEITIKNLLGNTVAMIPVDAYFALPKSLRYRTINWESGFMFGYYRAHLELNRGYDDVVDTETISFWVLPLKEIALGLLALLILAGLIYAVISRFEIKRK